MFVHTLRCPRAPLDFPQRATAAIRARSLASLPPPEHLFPVRIL